MSTTKLTQHQLPVPTPSSKPSTNSEISPTQKTFQIPELLQNILIHLSPREIYRCTLVCRQCRDILQTSITLRKKLFLHPSSATSDSWYLFAPKKGRRGRMRDRYFTKTFSSTDEPEPFKYQVLKLNPVLALCAHRSDLLVNPKALDQEMPVVSALREVEKYEEITLTLPCSYHPSEFALWHESYLTDPPCTKATVTRLELGTHGSTDQRIAIFKYEIENKKGLRVRDVMQELLKKELGFSFVNESFVFPSKKKMTVSTWIQRFEKDMRAQAFVRGLETVIRIRGAVIPSEQELRDMETDGRTFTHKGLSCNGGSDKVRCVHGDGSRAKGRYVQHVAAELL